MLYKISYILKFVKKYLSAQLGSLLSFSPCCEMSRRCLQLDFKQKSFVDEDTCKSLIKSSINNECQERPPKRRRTDIDSAGWIALHELTLDCHLIDSAEVDSASFLSTGPVDVDVVFDDPIITVVHSQNLRSLVAYICNDNDTPVLDEISWIQNKVNNDASISQCLRYHTSLSFLLLNGTITRIQVHFRLDARFDHNLQRAPKFRFKDRLRLLDYTFGSFDDEVNADKFYAKIGSLPKDSINHIEKTIQHPALNCKLFPFQARAVSWMLQREERPFVISKFLEASCSEREKDIINMPPLWASIKDLDDQNVYVNRHQAYATSNVQWLKDSFPQQSIRGGILAEVFSYDFVANVVGDGFGENHRDYRSHSNASPACRR